MQFCEASLAADTPPYLSLKKTSPLPKDPLPDSDEEAVAESRMQTMSPHSTEHLGTSKDADAKWWHIPDTQIAALLQTMEVSAVDDANNAPKLLKSRSCPSAPSSTCRPLAKVGRPKSGQMDMSNASRTPVFLGDSGRDAAAYGHAAVDTLAISSTLLRDVQVRDAVAKGLTWPLEDRRQFNTWTSPKRGWTDAHLLLSQTKGHSSCGPSSTQSAQSRCTDSCERPSTAKLARPQSQQEQRRTGRRPGFKQPAADDRESVTVQLAFYHNSDRINVLLHPDARVGPDPGDHESDKMTLKGTISNLTGMAPCDQRLLCRGFDVSDDLATLRKAGVSHGSTITLYDRKDMKKNQTILACTAKRLQQQEKHQQQNVRRAKMLQESRKEKKGTAIMPKWRWGIPPDNTQLGIGYNDAGKNSSFRFENHHIWYDEADYRLTDIRSHQAYTQPVEYTSQGVPPHCE